MSETTNAPNATAPVASNVADPSVFPKEDGKGVVTDTAAQARRDGTDVSASEDVSIEEALEQAAEATKKSNKRKLKLKVDNQEVEEEIDLDNEEELREHLQMSKVARKRMQEAAELRKAQESLQRDVQDFINAMRDPSKAAEILSDPRIGLDIKQFAQQIINQEIEDMKKSPEQKEKERLQKELETLKKEKEDRERLLEEEKRERVKQQYAQQLEKDIQEALEVSSLPKRPYIVKRIVENLAVAMENGLDDVSVKDVIPLVERQYREDLKEMFDAYPEETLEQLLGTENVDRLRRYRIRKLKKNAPKSMESAKEPTSQKQEASDMFVKKNQNARKFFRSL